MNSLEIFLLPSECSAPLTNLHICHIHVTYTLPAIICSIYVTAMQHIGNIYYAMSHICYIYMQQLYNCHIYVDLERAVSLVLQTIFCRHFKSKVETGILHYNVFTKKNIMVILLRDWIQNWTQYGRDITT